METVVIKPFKKEFQDKCKKIILSGLEEHWGWLDESLNPDLDNIELNYKEGIFLTGWIGDELIATGAATILTENTSQIVRMSVNRKYRSKGIGTQLLNALTTEAKKLGVNKLILETTTQWEEVVSFYVNSSFDIIKEENGDTYFEKMLTS